MSTPLINLTPEQYLKTFIALWHCSEVWGYEVCASCLVVSVSGRLKLGNACYHSMQNLLSSRLLSKNLKIKIYRTIILPVVLYGCETWSLTLREERRLRVFENRVLRVFGPKRDEVTGMEKAA